MIVLRKVDKCFNDFKEVPFKSEKDLQSFFEKNLNKITNLDFVCSEFKIENRRIDTLAFDKETKSFVIIEYKKGKHSSVFDQGMAYLSIALVNKSDLVAEYNKTMETNNTENELLKKNDVD